MNTPNIPTKRLALVLAIAFSLLLNPLAFAVDVPITITDGDSTPQPALVDEEVVTPLSASVDQAPQGRQECHITEGPNWKWSVSEVQFKSENGEWETPSSNSYTSTFTDDSAQQTELKATFQLEGDWRVRTKVTVNYASNCGDAPSGQAQTYVGSEEFMVEPNGTPLAMATVGAPSPGKKIVVGKVRPTLSTPNIDRADREDPGASVMFNDDNDDGATYSNPVPAGHYPLEPVMDYIKLRSVSGEDDLMAVTLDVKGLRNESGVAILRVAGSDKIRVWPSATKGAASSQIASGTNFNISSLPRTVYVEGKGTGAAALNLDHSYKGKTYTDRLVVNVVSLKARQGDDQWVINAYNTPIEFKVEGGSSSGKSQYRWDLDDDGKYGYLSYETATQLPEKTVKYGPTQTSDSVLLQRTIANHRKSYDVSVRLTGGLVLRKRVLVALDQFTGTALTGSTNAERQAEVTGLGAVNPWAAFAALPTTGTFSQSWFKSTYGVVSNNVAANRLQYAPTGLSISSYAATPFTAGAGNLRRVYAVLISPKPYIMGAGKRMRGEDVTAVINHENRHVAQHNAVQYNNPPNNSWALLDRYFFRPGGSGTDGYSSFRESDAYLNELQDSRVGWYYLRGSDSDSLIQLSSFFKTAINDQAKMGRATPAEVQSKIAAFQLLQTLYQSIPSDFQNAKRPDYQPFIHMPEIVGAP